MALRISRAIAVAISAVALGGCVTTSMQGYADLQPPAHPIQRIAAIAPPALVSALYTEASKRGVVLEDANAILPPTRQYNEAEVRQAMAAHGIDGVLVVCERDGRYGCAAAVRRHDSQYDLLWHVIRECHGRRQLDLRHRHVIGIGIPPPRRQCIGTIARLLFKRASPIHNPAANFGSEVAKSNLAGPYSLEMLPAPLTRHPPFSMIFRRRV